MDHLQMPTGAANSVGNPFLQGVHPHALHIAPGLQESMEDPKVGDGCKKGCLSCPGGSGED